MAKRSTQDSGITAIFGRQTLHKDVEIKNTLLDAQMLRTISTN